MLHNFKTMGRLHRESHLEARLHGLLSQLFCSDACCLHTEAGGNIATKLTHQVDQIIGFFDDLTDLFIQPTPLILFAKLDPCLGHL